ncbi:MAG TPA: PQQ-binding-like beta-propeller repeat protein [bacterium]|nr:PQQ-binding-like beta-propeller repeat protein [bacterium]
MLYDFLKRSFLAILFTAVLSGCSSEIHREGKLLFFKSSGTELFTLYQNEEQNYLLSMELSPLKKGWEKKISGHPATPSFFLIDQFILCNCKKGKVCLLDNSNGEIVTSIESSAVITQDSTGFAVNNGIFYSICNSNSICAVNIEKDEPVWEFVMKDTEKVSLQFKVEGNYIIYGNDSGELVALNTKKGEEVWRTGPLENLEKIYTFPETVIAGYELIDGLDIAKGTGKWVTQHNGKVRCVMDGLIVAQSDDFFTVLFAENGLQTWNYPRTGTTFLTCQESLSLAAFTVKNLEDIAADEEDAADYFDKVYIFNATTGERIFDYNSSEDLIVLNMTGFLTDRFYLALEEKKEGYDEITVKMFSSTDFTEGLNYVFGNDSTNEEVYISWMHTDINYTVFRISTITGTPIETNFLFRTDTAEKLGRMDSYPEVVTGTNAYDIISYDDYFNIIEKTLPDFLVYD